MALTELLFGPKTHLTVGLVQFDASLSETHARQCEITDHPVEEGSTISDHIRRLPETLEVNGVVSNHPIVFLASLNSPSPITNGLTPATARAELAYSTLRKLMDDGELVTVVTSLWEYENMAITSMSVARDVNTGNVLNCSLSLREIIIAKTKTVDAPEPSNVGQKGAKDVGKKVPGAATAAQSAKSSSVLGSLASLFGG